MAFLGAELDEKFTMKLFPKKQMMSAKKKSGSIRGYNGTCPKPRSNTEISQKIYHSMIEPLLYYAPTITCLKTEGMFKKQEVILRKGATLAIHCPQPLEMTTVMRRLLYRILGKDNHHGVTLYQKPIIRSKSVQDLIQNCQLTCPTKYKRKTSLDIILPRPN